MKTGVQLPDELRQAKRDMIERLRERYREATFGGVTAMEMADIWGISVNAAHQRLRKEEIAGRIRSELAYHPGYHTTVRVYYEVE